MSPRIPKVFFSRSEGEEEELEFYDLSALYRLFKFHYIHTFILHTEERKERQNSDTDRHGIPPQPPWLFYVPGVQLRYTGPTFYVRWTMMNTMDIYNDKMNDMCEPASGIEPGSSA